MAAKELPSVECKVQLHHQRLSRLLMLHFLRQAEKSVNINKEIVEKEREYSEGHATMFACFENT